ncbi:AraC family transcriptional regulator [Marinicrinis lubricantis]|uniref:GyrI-like domain-containing protein n=1 Tax=Marinicrinis lubricantis TaxID=2086470 RepID=A0ABW1IN17_9BACL
MDRYIHSIRQVQDYIERHYAEKITLDQLADISKFSKYHFSRIFTSSVGTTPLAYITQQRLKKSLSFLMDTDMTILEISTLCGFESISNYNTAFKKYFEKTPSKVRKSLQKERNISLFLSNNEAERSGQTSYDGRENNFLRRIWQMNIQIRELPDYEVAYVRHVGSYLETYHAWGQLGTWAAKNNLFPPSHYYIGISLDDPATTEEYACRYDACITIPSDFKKTENEEVRFQSLPGGLYALYSFYDAIDKFAIAYQVIYGQWLPSSEYDPDDRYSLEFCMNNPTEDPEGKAKVDLYVPIRKRAEVV